MATAENWPRLNLKTLPLSEALAPPPCSNRFPLLNFTGPSCNVAAVTPLEAGHVAGAFQR